MNEARQRANDEQRIYVVVEDTGGYTVLPEESLECQRAIASVYPDRKARH